MASASSAESFIREALEWLVKLTSENFDRQCKNDMFCLGCRVAFCEECCPSHHHHISALQDKLCGTTIAPGSDGRKRVILHGVALHRRKSSASTVKSSPAGTKCCPSGISDSGKYCMVDCKHESQGGDNYLVSELLRQDFTTPHSRDRFCIDCCKSFAATSCSHHVDHRVLTLKKEDGCHYIYFSGEEDWAYFFDSVDTQKVNEDGKDYQRMLLKEKPLPTKKCLCGRAVEKEHCSAGCLRKERFR